MYAYVLIMFITAGEDTSWEEKMKAFIETERALSLKIMTMKKNIVNGPYKPSQDTY